ncbi:MAG: hypothetical protein ACKO21_09740, partial [Nodosilinea sp.]
MATPWRRIIPEPFSNNLLLKFLLDAGQAKLEGNALALEVRRLEAEEISLLGELKPMLGLAIGDSVLLGEAMPSAVPAD